MYFSRTYDLLNGSKIGIGPIYGNGKTNQLVIYGGADWGKDSIYPLSKYQEGEVFCIKKVGTGTFLYKLEHLKSSNQFLINKNDTFSSSVLFDLFKWQDFQKSKTEDLFQRNKNTIELLKRDRELLSSILKSQGVKIITEEQAKILNLSENK